MNTGTPTLILTIEQQLLQPEPQSKYLHSLLAANSFLLCRNSLQFYLTQSELWGPSALSERETEREEPLPVRARPSFLPFFAQPRRVLQLSSPNARVFFLLVQQQLCDVSLRQTLTVGL